MFRYPRFKEFIDNDDFKSKERDWQQNSASKSRNKYASYRGMTMSVRW